MLATAQTAIAVIGIDIRKKSFHVVGLDSRGAIVLQPAPALNLASRMTREGAYSATKTTSRHRFTPHSPQRFNPMMNKLGLQLP